MGVTYGPVNGEAASSPGFTGNPFVSMPRGLTTPAIPAAPRITVHQMLPSTISTASASRSRPISELILTACLLTVYASHPPVTRRMAKLATGPPATALTGLDLHQLDFNKEFHCLITVPPFPRLSQRELIVAETRRNPIAPDKTYQE